MNPVDLTYRKTATAGASGFALLVALYDTLAGDLRRAASAQREGDLEQRTREAKHAFGVLAVLENWIEAGSGELAQKLIAFYAGMRRQILEAQVSQSAEMLEELMAEVLDVREVWQQMEDKSAPSEPFVLPPVARQRLAFTGEQEGEHFSWSA